MHTEDYTGEKTGLLLVDPYNDFLSPAGKLWPQAKEVAEEVNLLSNLKSIVNVARRSGIRIFFVPHHRWEPGDYTHWKHATTRQLAGAKNQMFAKGTWGGEWHPDFVPQEGDIIIKEHWAQSGFANTDLDQQLKQHGIEKIILIGMLAHLHRVHRPFRDGARLPRHLSQRCDGRFQLGRNARCRAKRSNLCARNRLHQRNGGCFVQSLNRLCR